MAVYREGYMILEQYEKQKVQIWNDACDEGVLINKGDKNYGAMMQLIEWYGDKVTRKVLGTGNQVQIEITLMDEWAVSDERKTIKEATEVYTVLYYQLRKGDLGSLIQKGYEGFYSITKNN